MRIANKIIRHTVAIAITAVALVSILTGVATYYSAKKSIENITQARFISLRDIKADQITQYFANLNKQVELYSNNLTVVEATKKFAAAFSAYNLQQRNTDAAKYRPAVIKHYLEQVTKKYAALNGGATINSKALIDVLDEKSFDLQYYYILENPYVLEDKSKLNYAEDGTEYSSIHKLYHNEFKEYKEKFGLYDLLLVDAESGRVVYSVMKELDFSTSLKNGPYANSGCGMAFRRAEAATSRDFVALEDFSPYIASYNQQAAFLASPIYDGDKKVGVMIFQLGTDEINNIMTSNNKWQEVGLGNTGESYIIGADHMMRSMSRFFIENPDGYLASMKDIGLDQMTVDSMSARHTNIGLQPINTDVGNAVIAGKEGFMDYTDYRGVRALTAFKPLNIPDLHWGMICGIDADEALSPVYLLGKKIAIYTLIITLIISFIAIMVSQKLSRQLSIPIERLCSAVSVIAETQDLTKRVDSSEIREISDIAKAINGLVSSFQKVFITTVESTMEMQAAAGKLKQLAANAQNPYAGYTSNGVEVKHGNGELNTNYSGTKYAAAQQHHTALQSADAQQFAHNTDAIKQSGENLEELSMRLQNLSRQFKIFEEEADRTSDW